MHPHMPHKFIMVTCKYIGQGPLTVPRDVLSHEMSKYPSHLYASAHATQV